MVRVRIAGILISCILPASYFILDVNCQNVTFSTSSKAVFRPEFKSISGAERHVYNYTFNQSMLSLWPAYQLQFYAESELRTENTSEFNYPLLVTVHWHGSIRSWEIPVQIRNDTKHLGEVNRYSDNIVGKILWHFPEDIPRKPWELRVEVSVFSEVMVFYKMKIIAVENFNIPATHAVENVVATPSSPAVYKFDVPARSWEYIFIQVTSDSDICAIMTVQPPLGPFLDKWETTGGNVLTETFTRKTGLTLRADKFPKGFMITFTPFETDEKCVRHPKPREDGALEQGLFRKKVINFEVRESLVPLQYYSHLFFPLAICFGFSFFCFLLMWKFHQLRCEIAAKVKSDCNLIHRPHSIFKSNLTIDDLIVTAPSRLTDQSRRYCRAAFVSSAFYCVPVFQLIMTFGRRLIDTGNFDTCYFNHYCSHMLGNFHDFNHMYSNIGYIYFGSVYIVLVRIRQLTLDQDNDEVGGSGDKDSEKQTIFRRFFPKTETSPSKGVIMHFSLLYSFGFAVIMMGIMSAGYHICPNQSNFQFDTVFMYTIAAICVVTIYQYRHPTYLSANFTFTALAVVTCITVLGLLWEEFFIRVIFSVGHMVFLILSLPKVCYNGYIRRKGLLVARWNEVMSILFTKFKDDWKNSRLFKIQRNVWISPVDAEIVIIPGPGRLIVPGFLLLINCVSIIMMWTILKKENFATQVLFICVMNGALYTVFYSILKLYHGEGLRILWLQAFMYLILSFILWGLAVSFFLNEVSTWETSPAESRLKNSECVLMGFYDSHDMWHFLSAAGLFCSAMVLLTVDDDLVDQPKSSIPVF